MLLKTKTYHNSSIKIILLFVFIGLLTTQLIGQEINKRYTIDSTTVNSKDKIDPEAFNETLLEEIIFDQINFYLENEQFDSKQKNNVLTLASKDQATYMAFVESARLIRDENVKTETIDRLIAFGGSGYGKEIISKNSIINGKIFYSYAKIANDIVFKWFASSKTSKLIKGYQFNLIGIGVKLDEKQRKVYTSVVLGNFKSFNDGPKYLSNLQIPYSTKTYGLTTQNASLCKPTG